MSDAPTGGAAFPRPGYYPETEGRHREDFAHVLGTVTSPLPGMSLRDWFAGKALAGFLAGHAGEGVSMPGARNTAEAAWRYADAMIERRDASSTLKPLGQVVNEVQLGELPPIPPPAVPDDVGDPTPPTDPTIPF